ncbi:hypothetical protein Trydic_g13408 [Trypoxylus dichotomus]
MALMMRDLFSVYDHAYEHWRDPRADDWPLMGSGLYLVGLLATYFYCVLDLGPKLMEKRKPFNLDKVLLAYNAIQVVYCSTLLYFATRYIAPYYNFRCEPCDYSDSFRGVLSAKLTWWYFLSKVIDLLDTVFFVMRKKNNQITFLHVYHHGGMVLLTWIGARFIPGGSSLTLGYLNCIVHVVMYSYYFLSVWDKDYGRNVWLKKQVTRLQMIQFGLITVAYVILLLTEDCGFPKIVTTFLIPQNLFMFYLFADFYYNTYVKPGNSVKKEKKED